MKLKNYTRRIKFIDFSLSPTPGQELTYSRFIVIITDKLNEIIDRVNDIGDDLDKMKED
jgi:hypothetical protein